MSNTIITITGPSCSGKTTLARLLMDTGVFTEVISTTTRAMRSGEKNGVTYHFVTPEEFDKIDMLERIDFNGNTYGGSIAEFEEKFASGLIPAIVVEPNGMEQINLNATKKGWTVINLYIDCPPLLQAERFLFRFIEDYRSILANGSNEDYAKLMEEYAGRMATMQEVESKWFDMFKKHVIWDHTLIIGSFEKSDEETVIALIIQLATGLTEAA